jgi:hypothetical protein
VNQKQYKDIQIISKLLDAQFTLPGGFKVGLDGVIGLIPGVGDTISSVIGSYIIIRGLKQKIPKIIIYKMIFNLLVDQLVGMIPFLGDLFDFVYKSNLRNAELFLESMNRPKQAETLSWISLALVLLIIIIVISAPFALILLLLFYSP